MADEPRPSWFGYENFERLYALNHSRIVGQARARLRGDQATVEDITQDTLLHLVEKESEWDQRGASFSHWLYTATHYLIKEVIHAREKEQKLEKELQGTVVPEEYEHNPEMLYGQKEEQALVRQKIAELPSEQRRVLEAKVVEDLDNHEIAEQLGKNPKTVGALAYQGRKLLVRKLAPYR